jgi:undecaprenyl phosphate-alpha-L-ara4FN deformylase
LLKLTEASPANGHVFTLHAELEGMRLLSVFEQLLTGWKEQGYDLVSTRAIYANLNLKHLPYFNAVHGEIAGRSGHLLLQGLPYLPQANITKHARTNSETTVS